MSNYVFCIDTHKQPLNPIHPAKARQLLTQGKAAVFRTYPFTIILKEARIEEGAELELKLDPGSKTTGIAILSGNQVIWGAELSHRGQAIKASLESRRASRKGRRTRKTRYRKTRFLNRTKPKGWLAPSLQHRVATTMTWVRRLIKVAPIAKLAQELVRFDMQQIQNPGVSGVGYQQGTLHQYEVREYLLEKWGRTCAYCGAKDTPLEVEHIVPKAKGGTNRISNLTLACVSCNQKKGTQDIKDFLLGKPDLLKRIEAQAKAPLKDAAAVNTTRWALFNSLKATGLLVSVGSGGLTKFNRTQQGLEKTHWIDAACVGDTPTLVLRTSKPLIIQATGHGTRQMCRTNKYGFPIRYVPRTKYVQGFQTGDIVRAIVTKGKKIGIYTGRIAVRSSGSFNITTGRRLIQSISYKYCKTIHLKDGYNYA